MNSKSTIQKKVIILLTIHDAILFGKALPLSPKRRTDFVVGYNALQKWCAWHQPITKTNN